jgi:hypothetical protein
MGEIGGGAHHGCNGVAFMTLYGGALLSRR